MLADAFGIAANLALVTERMARAAERCGRSPGNITLVAVSKAFPAEAIRAAHAAGLTHFGENKIQEREAKSADLPDLRATWHLIGHLQSNKARRAAQIFDRIDSLDSISLAQKLNDAAPKKIPVLIEVHLGEATKSGVNESDLPTLAQAVATLPNLELAGLMTIPPYTENPDEARPYFRRLRILGEATARRLGRALPVLSMGMSHDFEVAIEEGATEVRIGTALFGSRPAK